MSADLVFYTHPMSRGRIARWMLEEVGQPYRTEVLGFGPSMKAVDYLAINPMGKVPAITHKGMVVTECAAVCAYLADAFPQSNLAPPVNDPTRGTYYRWMFFAAGPLEAAVLNQALDFKVPPDKKGLSGYGSLEEVTDALANAVSKSTYICGENFTAADVYVGSHISWGMSFGTLEKRPAFEAYWARLKDRHAHIRACEIDDAIIAKEKAAAL